MPHFLVKSEFNKENQSKTIKYINLDKIYRNYTPAKKDIDEVLKKIKIYLFKHLNQLVL